jgi:hypothetical protein
LQFEAWFGFGWGQPTWEPINNLVHMANYDIELQCVAMAHHEEIIPYACFVDPKKIVNEKQHHYILGSIG